MKQVLSHYNVKGMRWKQIVHGAYNTFGMFLLKPWRNELKP